MTTGEKIAKLRRENNYTQEQLADLLGVSRQSISKWESNIAYPETAKLIELGKLFGCSMDYLLKEEVTEKQEHQPVKRETIRDWCGKLLRERRSERMLLGMPLYHVGRNARGFIAIGLRAKGVISVGLVSRGVCSLGLLSLGVFSLGVLSLGVFSAGTLTVGLMAAGAIALGIIAAGAISVGVVSMGALSVGGFSVGALAIGHYAAVGDEARAMIAVGKTAAEGSVYGHIGTFETADVPLMLEWLDQNVPAWLGWARRVFGLLVH
ncbi:MAG: helix-turn-helix transcriptional regulator [Clostridiales bacterium]|nr:helix-turn-helix transcriptional regulator [Clostridiales bacterium]